LTDFFTGAIMETRKAARSKVAASPPWPCQIARRKTNVKVIIKHTRFKRLVLVQLKSYMLGRSGIKAITERQHHIVSAKR